MVYHRNLLQVEASDAIYKDLRAIGVASRDIGVQLAVAASSGHFGFLRWLATIAAIFLIVVDRTNWKTDLLTGLLVPYIWFNLPPILFNFFRGEVGKWISLIGVIVRLFYPRKFPDEAELPVSLILLIVVAPNVLAGSIRNNWVGIVISLIIGIYLLYQHIHNAGGFRKAFAENGIPNTIGILLLFVSPLWELLHHYIF